MSGSPAGHSPDRDDPKAHRIQLRARLRVVVSRSECKRKILDAMQLGITRTAAIAAHLGMAAETVKRHFTQLFDRTGVHDKAFLGILWGEILAEDRMGETRMGEG